MPFTLSHPAAVIPLARRGLSLSALVIGSMAPDLPYFVLPSGRNEFSHCWQGALTLSFPVGLAVLWFFHATLKLPLLSLLPAAHRARLGPLATRFRWGGLGRGVWIAWSVLIGVFSHYLWDGMTHYYGWEGIAQFTNWSRFSTPLTEFVDKLPNFRTLAILTPAGLFYIFDILQYGSSIGGFFLLGLWYIRWFKETGEQGKAVSFQFSEKARSNILLAVGAASGLAMLVPGIQLWNEVKLSHPPGWFQGLIRQTAVMGLKAGLAQLLIYCLVWHWYATRSRRTQKPLLS
jgi:hypothetical protein